MILTFDGNQHLLFKAIVDHFFKKSAVTKDEEQEPQKSPGMDTSWEKLADLKESLTNEAAEYAAASNLCEEPER